ncbi:beta-1,3-galactosyltransferase 6 [Drosophila subpulchrella]|uniref:beta-1,3-galactosyltransferase 6 n=1 Tax=Drosophila subpulchrella TaxID=1486046 RepID=UPI0018A19822|nr:beta-1,3-galactosyltransferase 6 [Drosophila subpulchrella]
MRRLNNLFTFILAISAFFFGSFITKILSPADQCPAHTIGRTQLEPLPNVFLVVLVLSPPRNADQRNAMRRTWLRTARQPLHQQYYPEELIFLPTYSSNGHLQVELVEQQANRLRQYKDWQKRMMTKDLPRTQRHIKVKHVFAIGTWNISSSMQADLLKEQNHHNDLIMLQRHNDTYGNLTKKLIKALDFLRHHYDFSYVIKVDDDTFVKLNSLLNELVSYDRKLLRKRSEYGQYPLPQLYWGYFNGRATIKRKGLWKESNYFLSKNYLPYALGGGYVLSRELCEYIANSSQLLTPYVSEDVSVGTWLAPLRHVYRWHDPRFDTAYMPRKCQPYHMVLHKRSLEMMTDVYDGKLCSGTGSSSLSEYFYDWKKATEKCCDSLVV